MTKVMNILGAPGCGKTTALVKIFTESAKVHGPDRVAAITYTRAAASELRQRVAIALGLTGSEASLKIQIPFVGTVHSMAYRAMGLNSASMVDGRNGVFREFCEELKLPVPHDEINLEPDQMDSPYWYAEVDVRDTALVFRRALSAARQRGLSLVDYVDRVDIGDDESVLAGMPHLGDLERRYTAWKRRIDRYDFEDLLEVGRRCVLPVKVLLADEQQDNSALLWSVVDAWGAYTELCVRAGDPFQAIFLFNGADPHLYISRIRATGEVVPLKTSYRLTHESAGYAKNIIRQGGWDEDALLSLWDGAADGLEADGGTTFYLARTHNLLRFAEEQLLDDGEPYLKFKGPSPFSSKEAQAYRLFTDLLEGRTCEARGFRGAVECLENAALPRGAKQRAKHATGTLTVSTAERVLEERVGDVRSRLKHAGYLHRIELKYGAAGLYMKPKTTIGTIHCSPPGEPILTVNRGYVPIEQLNEATDKLVSYDPRSAYATWGLRRGQGDDFHRTGFSFSRSEIKYWGDLLTVSTDTSTTQVTPNHLMLARFAPAAESKYLVYLMRRGGWWRIGQTKVLRTHDRSAGLTRRMGNELADEAWILGLYDSQHDALYQEARLSMLYGIPDQGFWSGGPGGWKRRLSDQEYADIFDESASPLEERAHQMLDDLALYPELPFYVRGAGHLRSDRRTFRVHAANLIPDLMVLPVLEGDSFRPRSRNMFEWQNFEVHREPYTGLVYDLDVWPHHHYVSGGLVVHNSAKGKEADHVKLISSWAYLPGRSLATYDGLRGESCVAYVAASRHRVSLELIPGLPGIEYEFPRTFERTSDTSPPLRLPR